MLSSLKKENKEIDDVEDIDIKIEFIEDSYTFSKKTYSKLLLQHIISEEDYNNIVKKCSIFLGKALIDKKQNDKITFPWELKYAFLLILILLITFFATLAPSLTPHENREVLFTISFILIIIIISFGIFLSLYNFFYKIRTFRNLSWFITRLIEPYLNEVNEKYSGKIRFGLHDIGKEENRYLFVVLNK